MGAFEIRVEQGEAQLETPRMPLDYLLPDKAADPETVQAITDDMDMMEACIRDPSRLLNFYSDRALAEFQDAARPLLRSWLETGQPPDSTSPDIDWIYLGVAYVRMLSDGSASVLILYDDPTTEALTDPVNWILIHERGHWVFDYLPDFEEEVIETSVDPDGP